MKTKTVQPALGLACLLVLQSVSAAAQENDTVFSLATGAEFTTGTYGGDFDIEDTYIPVTATADFGRIALRLSVPWLSVTGPEDTIYDTDGVPLPGSGQTITESGLGDVIGSITVYDVLLSQRYDLAMDLTGKVKFGTADDEKGLGTGANDYSVQADLYKFFDEFTLVGSIGYTFRGDSPDLNLDDVLTGAVGGTYKFTPAVKGGLFLSYRASTILGRDDIRELTAFVSRRFAEDWRLQVYVLTGFSDSSPDWGGGVQIRKVLRRRG